MNFKSWIALILLALVGLTDYYVYDSITSIDYLVKSSLHFTSDQFGLLYSFYSVANVFFLALLIAGFLVDYWGYLRAGFVFASLCLIGTLLTTLGASSLIPKFLYPWLSTSFSSNYSPELKVMLLGRMIFGTGSEALLIVIMKALVGWFGKRHIAVAFASAIVLYRFGTFLTLNLQVNIAEKYGLNVAFWCATLVMFCGWLIYIIYLFYDRLFKPKIADLEDDDQAFKLRDIASFPISFWYLTLICITFYGAITSFEIFDPDILKYKFNFSPRKSGFLASMLMVSTMICMPVLGWIIDKVGKRATFLVTGCALAILALLGFMFFPAPTLFIFIIGIAYSLIATALWATVPIVIHHQCQGTAFGILSYIQNMGLMLFPWLSGYIADLYTSTSAKGERLVNYGPVLIFFVLTMLASFICSILLKMNDKRSIDEGALSMEKFKE